MFVCKSCGATSSKWMGKCSDCEEWNTFEEHAHTVAPKNARSRYGNKTKTHVLPHSEFEVDAIKDIVPQSTTRIPTGSQELDRVLGGGLLFGSVVLLGGEPGIGKSTLLLQTAATLSEIFKTSSEKFKVLYVCTEESRDQVALRARRLGVQDNELLLSSEYRIEHIDNFVHSSKPKCIIVDSIQALRSFESSYMSGQGAHIRNCAAICCEWAQQYNSIVIMVAHITKEGIIAGPKLIEHMVDSVLMFEKAKHNIRFLYAHKNRHGAVDEVGVLQMKEKGLMDITDIGHFFLEHRTNHSPPGVCVTATFEGTRPFLVEIQSLTVPCVANNRVFSDKIDPRQVSRVAAVLEKHLGIALSNQNLYVNVAGGIRISEPGMELALSLSLYSAYQNIALPPKLCAIGELSLPGEIHSVEHFSQRCRQAHEYGFTHVVAPRRNIKETKIDVELTFIEADTIGEAIQLISDLNT